MKLINELRNKFQGHEIYVIASGKSMDFINPEFFEDKVVVGVNDVYIKFKCDYVVRKEYDGALEALKSVGDKLVIAEFDCGGTRDGKRNEFDGYEYYYFKHKTNQHAKIDFEHFDNSEYLIVSWSTITSAIHFAMRLGAKRIILCGHDCGSIDGKWNFDGYQDFVKTYVKADDSTPMSQYADYEDQTKVLVEQIRKRGVEVYSLNPFINLALEGHVYSKKG